MASNYGPRRPDSQTSGDEDKKQTSTRHRHGRRPHSDLAPLFWVDSFTEDLLAATKLASRDDGELTLCKLRTAVVLVLVVLKERCSDQA